MFSCKRVVVLGGEGFGCHTGDFCEGRWLSDREIRKLLTVDLYFGKQ